MSDLMQDTSEGKSLPPGRLGLSFNIHISAEQINKRGRGFEHQDLKDPLAAPKILGELAQDILKLNVELKGKSGLAALSAWAKFLSEHEGRDKILNTAGRGGIRLLNPDIPSLHTLHKALLSIDQDFTLSDDLVVELESLEKEPKVLKRPEMAPKPV